MNRYLRELFEDRPLVQKIESRLPRLFAIAEMECSRAGRTGMQVGSMREAIVIALLIYRFGPDAVKDFPITEPEKDVDLFGGPVSIKTITGGGFGGIKASWTVDQRSAQAFADRYRPSSDILLVQINWGGEGGMYYIPLGVQAELLQEIGIENYIDLPKEGTNPRGSNFSEEAVLRLVHNKDTKAIKLLWPTITDKSDRSAVYKRWIDYWSES